MTVRACTPADAETLRRVAVESFTETFAADNSEENMRRYLEDAFAPERFEAELRDARVRYFLLLDGEETAGYLKLCEGEARSDPPDGMGEDALEIARIYVLGAFQGRGCGGLLMEHALRTARELGKRRVWLGVWEHNRKAIAFYEHVGFVRSGSHSFLLGDDEQTDYVMTYQIQEIR